VIRDWERPPRSSARLQAVPPRGGWGRSALIWVLAGLYPFHRVLEGLRVSVSLGDGVVALIAVIVVFNLAAASVPVPRYAKQAAALLAAIATSLTVNAFLPSHFFSLRDALIEGLKFLGVASWMIAVFWLVCDDFPRRYVQWSVVSIAIATGFAIWTVVENVALRVARPSGPFENPNIYANYLGLNAFLALALSRLLAENWAGGTSLTRRGLQRLRTLLPVAILPTLVLGMLSTGSRGGLLGFLVGLAVTVPWRMPRLNVRRAATFVVTTLVLGGALFWFFERQPFLVNRVAAVTATDPNVAQRVVLWRAARHAFYAHPVFGIGYGQFPAYARHDEGLFATESHQTYLSAGAELGILGLGALLWLLLSVIRDAWRASVGTGSTVTRAFCGFVVATAVQGFFTNVDQFRSLWIVFGLAAASIRYLSTTRSAHHAAPAP